jgi:hypothetical protein
MRNLGASIVTSCRGRRAFVGRLTNFGMDRDALEYWEIPQTVSHLMPQA